MNSFIPVVRSFISGAEIRPVTEENIWQVGELAEKIFPPTYREIVGAGQVDYMMELIYKPEALVGQLTSGQQFLLLYFEGQPAGFASYTSLSLFKQSYGGIPEGYLTFTTISEEGDFKLNKFYIDYRLQGNGLGKYFLSDVIERVKKTGGRVLQLNVNRQNTARAFYEKMGFQILKEEKIDIGHGYFMEDYLMFLNL